MSNANRANYLHSAQSVLSLCSAQSLSLCLSLSFSHSLHICLPLSLLVLVAFIAAWFAAIAYVLHAHTHTYSIRFAHAIFALYIDPLHGACSASGSAYSRDAPCSVVADKHCCCCCCCTHLYSIYSIYIRVSFMCTARARLNQ